MDEDKKFTSREKLALWCLLLIVKVVKPMKWDNDYKEEMQKVKELIEIN